MRKIMGKFTYLDLIIIIIVISAVFLSFYKSSPGGSYPYLARLSLNSAAKTNTYPAMYLCGNVLRHFRHRKMHQED